MIRRSPTPSNDAFVRDRATWLAYLSQGCFAFLEAGLGVVNVYPLAFTAALAAAPGRADLVTARLVMLGGAAILVLPLTLGLLAGAVGIEIAFGIGLPLLLEALALTSAERRVLGAFRRLPSSVSLGTRHLALRDML
jgi:hypothetical protein